jgi:hypothetical protein
MSSCLIIDPLAEWTAPLNRPLSIANTTLGRVLHSHIPRMSPTVSSAKHGVRFDPMSPVLKQLERIPNTPFYTLDANGAIVIL